MTDAEIEELRPWVVRLRAAIDRAKVEYDGAETLPFVNHWPKDCCDAPYLFLMVYERGFRGMIQKNADVSHLGDEFGRHIWMEVDGVIIDITADQFPSLKNKVIVARHSPWHQNLKIIENKPWASHGDDEYYNQYLSGSVPDIYWVYEDILPAYAPPPPRTAATKKTDIGR